MSLCTAASLKLYFQLENKTDNDIILKTELNPEFFDGSGGRSVSFLLQDDKEPISKYVYASKLNHRILPEKWMSFIKINIVKNDELLTLPPLEILNTIISSLCVTDSSGNILLTEKDITNDSFIRYNEVSTYFVIEVTEEK